MSQKRISKFRSDDDDTIKLSLLIDKVNEIIDFINNQEFIREQKAKENTLQDDEDRVIYQEDM